MVHVQYVDGSARRGSPENWRVFPGEGVDWVEVTDPLGTVHMAAASLYWLYPEGAGWVAGWASVGYDPNPVTEIVFDGMGGQQERKLRYLPDLHHRDVKLGHWWLGTSEPADG